MTRSVRRLAAADRQVGCGSRVVVSDAEAVIGRWRAGRVELSAECQASRGALASKVVVSRPRKPEHKRILERAHGCLERSYPAEWQRS